MVFSDHLKKSVSENGPKTALIFKEKKWSYSGLVETIERAASGFQSNGIREGDRVGILLKNSPEFIFTVFALSRIGAIAVPINFMQKADEVLFICSDVGAAALVTQTSFLETACSVQKNCKGLKTIWLTDPENNLQGREIKPFSSLTEKSPESIQGAAIRDEQTAVILYTSGTGGRPKGAMLSQKNLTSNALACIQALGLSSKDKFICLLPMFHVFALTTNILVPLFLGVPITIVESIRPPKPWLKLLWKDRITVFAAVPQIYSVLTEQAKGIKRWILKYLFFRTVRFCISGAAPLPLETMNRFEKKFGLPLLEGYGLTETSPVVSVNTLAARKIGTVGRILPQVEVKITDENQKALPIGEEGEICIRGPNVMQGYYKLPEETREAFTPDGWFKTGDVGSLDSEGFLKISDRIKDMIIVKGLKVFSVQVEEALLSHPAVAEAAVVGIPSPDGNEIIKGFVVLKEGAAADKSELLKWCGEKLSGYKRPRDIEIRTQLPKNALQKILKRELRKGG